MPPNRAYTIKDLADRWGCSTQAIYDLISRGALKIFKVGRLIRISPEEVTRYETG